ncbi:MAG: hypothetical protein JNL21_02185 [Myxococcales bacterium]|nr:hypothetical protein [Myxococcales bacterium]
MRSRALPFALAFVVAALWVALPLARGGAWDPYELDAADLARRVSVHVFGAADLARPEDPPSIPTLSDLGMGELPFTSMALAFRFFGVSETVGRGTMAAWAVAGALSLFWLLRRAGDTKAAFFAVVVLVTMPLYALQGRTMLGDAVSLAAFMMATAGLTIAAIGSGRTRVASGALAALGLISGFLSRGLLLGISAPCLSVGLALLLGGSLLPQPTRARPAFLFGATLTIVGGLAAARFCFVAWPLVDTDAPLDREVGMVLWDPSPNDSTFDRLFRQIGHALFPWSALLPWAFGRALAPRAPVGSGSAEPFVRVALAVSTVVAFACGTLVVPWAGPLPFLGIAPLAGLVALALRDLDRVPARSWIGVLAAGVAFALLTIDFSREPARTLSPFVVPSAVLPAGFEPTTKHTFALVAALATPVGLLAVFGSSGAPPRRASELVPFARARVASARSWAREIGRAVLAAFQGNLVFFLVVFEAALVGLAAMLFIGRRAGWEAIVELPHAVVEIGTMLWWALPIGLAVVAVSLLVVQAAWESLVGLSRLGAGGALGLLVATASSILGFSHYPALAAELSPKEVFETYRSLRTEGDELGLLGASPRAGSFYAGRAVPSFGDEDEAFAWLDHAGDGRRFLVLKSRDLPKLNARWRSAHKTNLPVVDARRSEILLATSRLDGDTNRNPLGSILLESEPAPAHVLSTRFLDHLDVLGWQAESLSGQVVDSVVPGEPFRLVFFYRVAGELGDWQAFVHLDGRTRHNADHAPLAGRYPMPLWRAGDLVRDEVEVTLPPNFGPGEIWVFFGFFQGKTRLRVTEGEHREDRAVAGKLRVR